MKVGAHLGDTRVLVGVWEDDASDEANVTRIVNENLLALPSHSRARDVMVRALRPRFVTPDAGIIPALRCLMRHSGAFRDACYYELTRVDALVAAFAAEQLAVWWNEGRTFVSTSDAREWIDRLVGDKRVPCWSTNIRDRVARGMMAALRDLGRLTGKRSSPRKEIVRPGISAGGFAYVAFRLHQQGESSRAILASTVWQRWSLDEKRVDEMMHHVASTGAALYSIAGSTLRIDWRTCSLAEVVDAIV
ncbi:BrxA family protein [Candidatus Poriferisodalis sp.]|uniref:BrxA family protein n=1 Tax=Candidatus Poriferisodalis sp. TaxID=3101277 RepID=UPI003B01D50E